VNFLQKLQTDVVVDDDRLQGSSHSEAARTVRIAMQRLHQHPLNRDPHPQTAPSTQRHLTGVTGPTVRYLQLALTKE